MSRRLQSPSEGELLAIRSSIVKAVSILMVASVAYRGSRIAVPSEEIARCQCGSARSSGDNVAINFAASPNVFIDVAGLTTNGYASGVELFVSNAQAL